MSETDSVSSEQQAPVRHAAVALTSGAMLRQAREALGLHIGALAVSLKVPVKKLEALEADRFDLLPDTVFVRALASSVCRTLKIDPQPILEKLPHTALPRLRAYESGVKVPYRSSGGRFPGLLREPFSKPLLWLVAVLLMGALALVLLPYSKPAAESAASNSASTDVSASPPLSAPVVDEPASAQVPAPGASLVLSPDLVAGSGAVTGTVVFRAQALSWVEVVDASGVVQVRRNMAVGETVGASGVLPLKVVVGRADTTSVAVRGVPLDLLSIANNNVARFEVK